MGHQVPTISFTIASSSMPQSMETLFPIANGLPNCDFDEWIPTSGDAWQCIEDNPHDGSTSYIHICGISTHTASSDVSYTQFVDLPDSNIPAGSVIDYVRIVAIVKNCTRWDLTEDGTGCEQGQPGTDQGFFQLLASTDDCTSIVSSSQSDLPMPTIEPTDLCYGYDTETNWYSINHTMTSDPSGNPWTLAILNDLQIGIKGRADQTYGQRTMPYIMETCISSSRWIKSAGGTNSVTVIQDDDDATYMLYPIDDGDPTGNPLAYVINDNASEEWDFAEDFCDLNYIGISLCARACKKGIGANIRFKILIEHGGVTYYSSGYTRTTSTFSNSYWDMTRRPWDNQHWEHADFDPSVTTFGVVVTSRSANAYLHVSEFSLTPTSDFGMGELRCTQLYAAIAYHSPAPSPCMLPKPVTVEVAHDIDSTELNFWSGNRDVYANGRNNKRLLISGLMWDGCTDGTTECEDLIECIRTLAKYQKPITLAGMRYSHLNTNYNIISFGWKQKLMKPNTYDWQMELEFCDDSPEVY